MGFHPLLSTPFAFLPAHRAGHPAWVREAGETEEFLAGRKTRLPGKVMD